MIKELLEGLVPLISSLAGEQRPVFLYGMGDGAEKIHDYLLQNGIAVKGVVASDGFVRGQSFLGFDVMRISEAEAAYGKLCLVLCFGLEDDRFDVLGPVIKRGHRVVSPNLPVFGSGLCDHKYITENIDSFERIYSMLDDGISKKVFSALIKYNVTGDIGFLEVEGAATPVAEFYTRGGRHLDIGAYDGDTVKEFIEYSNGNYGEIMAFEPDKKTFKKLVKNTAELKNVTAVNALVGDKTGKCAFSSGGGRASHGGEGEDIIDCTAIDDFCGFKYIDSEAPFVGSIKIDAEGMDEAVICGAANALYKCKSNVCAAVYHRFDDIIKIPLLLRSFDYKYKFKLRKKPCLPAWDVFIYALK